MSLDMRVPLGAFFTIAGAILVLYGVFGDGSVYARSLGIDVNLDWGVVMLVFGMVMLYFGARSRRGRKL